MAKTSIRIEGLRELDEALGELSKATARNTMRRALTSAAEPMRAEAERNAPRETGQLANSIAISAQIGRKNDPGKAAFAETMRGGGTRTQARQALIAANRAAGVGESFAEVYMGPRASNKRNSIKAIVQEFGSVKQVAQPYMRPAFDSQARTVLSRIGSELKTEIDKSAARAARRAARKAAKG